MMLQECYTELLFSVISNYFNCIGYSVKAIITKSYRTSRRNIHRFLSTSLRESEHERSDSFKIFIIIKCLIYCNKLNHKIHSIIDDGCT